MATLKEVAQRAGVSITTVSIIANGKAAEKHISPQTVERVTQVMEELQYRPNNSARQLRSKIVHRPTIGFYWPLDLRTNMLGYRLSHLQSVLLEQDLDYEIVVQNYFNNRIEDFIAPIEKGRFDGVIIGAASERDVEMLEKMDLRTPIILLNRDSRKYSTVGVNNSHLGTKSATLIYQKGYRNCALIKTVDRYAGTSQRTKAFVYACKQLGIELRPEWTFSALTTISGGAQAAEEYCTLQERPRVIYCEADCMAQGVAYTLQRMGLSIPEDVEILAVGQQISETMKYLHPSLSCVSLPPNVDKMAMSAMIRILTEKLTAPVHMELEPLVQLRESFTL